MKPVTRILAIIGVNCLVLGIGVVFIELIFGAWLSPNSLNRLNRLNLIKDRILTFDASSLYETTEPFITYSRDEYGLRGTHGEASNIDLLTVGGSTTDQRYIRDGETWQARLQQQFTKAGISLVISNAGVDGQSTYGHIKNFEWWFPYVPGLAPKHILFYVGLNDLHVEPGNKYDRLRRQHRGLRQIVSEKSAIWHLARTIRGSYRAMVSLKLGHDTIDFSEISWTREPLQDDYEFMQPWLDAFGDRLRVLAAETRDLGAEPIFVSQPARKYRIIGSNIEGVTDTVLLSGREVNGVDFHYMLRRINKVTGKVALETGARFVDLASYTEWEDTDFYDHTHMTPDGTKKVAMFLYEELKEFISAAMPSQTKKPE